MPSGTPPWRVRYGLWDRSNLKNHSVLPSLGRDDGLKPIVYHQDDQQAPPDVEAQRGAPRRSCAIKEASNHIALGSHTNPWPSVSMKIKALMAWTKEVVTMARLAIKKCPWRKKKLNRPGVSAASHLMLGPLPPPLPRSLLCRRYRHYSAKLIGSRS